MSFTITKVAWYTHSAGVFPRDEVVKHFRTIARFLDANGLSSRKLLDPVDQEITDDFAIGSDDVTAEGLEFMKQGYQKWLKAIDRGKPPDDDAVLERELAKQRGRAAR